MAEKLFLGVEHIGIKAADIEQAVKFYTEMLGFSIVNRMKPGAVELVFLSLGGSVVELVEAGEEFKGLDGVVNHLALHVSDIFAAVDRLRQHNVECLTAEPVAIGANRYNFFFRGPSGERIELFQG